MSSTAAKDTGRLAQGLVADGAALVFLDVPPGTEFGIDCNSWKVGSEFKGVKMIPPGIHLIYYSAVSNDKQVAPRTSFMHNFRQREILVRVWDKQMEDIKSEPISSDQQERTESNRQELDRYLGVYPYESFKKWVSLTNLVTPEIMESLLPESGKISAVTPLQSVGGDTESRRKVRESETKSLCEGSQVKRKWSQNEGEDDDDDDRLPSMMPCPGMQLRFTAIPRKKHPDGATAADVTRYNMDHSYVLRTALGSPMYGGEPVRLLGELQFAFIAFLIGQVFDGFEQWKRLVNLLCSCVEAVGEFPELFAKFISVLHFHISEIPEDFFVDIVSRDNFLTGSLSRFFENLEVSNSSVDLKKRGSSFRSNLEKRFKWNFSSEQDEYAPVVVA